MVVESKRFFSVAAADNLIIIKANKLWRDTFPNAITVTDVIHPDHYDNIPNESQCDPAKPIDISLNVIVGADEYKSHWFAHRSPLGHIRIEGLLLDTRTHDDEQLVSSILFQLNHNLMAPIAHIKGLINLLELQPNEYDRIITRIQSAASRIDDLIESINRDLLGE